MSLDLFVLQFVTTLYRRKVYNVQKCSRNSRRRCAFCWFTM